jgi:hypothetical protein
MAWAAVGAAAIGAVGAYSSSKNNKKAAEAGSTQKFEVDPRMQEILYGADGSNGLLQQIAGQASGTPYGGLAHFNGDSDRFLEGQGTEMLFNQLNGSNKLLNSNYEAPSMMATSVKAPAQNRLNLSPAFDQFIYGNAAEDPYLQKSLAAGVDLTNAGYQQNVSNLTDTLQRNVMPGIRSNAIAAGQFGGSRQGIAEGLAMSDYTRQLTDANKQLGLANSANILGAKSNAYNQGENRALSALLGLSGQQYGVAQQDAAAANAAASTNLGATMQTRDQNSRNLLAGLGAQSGLLGTAYNNAVANDSYQRNKLGQIAGTLAPFTGLGGATTSSQPYYSNTMGNALGGAAAGLSLWNQFGGSFGGNNSTGAPSNQLF